jgi:hypothetical protein
LIATGNCYQYQASQPEKQAALLALVSSVIDRWLPQTDHVILGCDWNASLRQRFGYCRAPPTVLADERILGWSVAAGLRYSAPEDPTWSSYNEQDPTWSSYNEPVCHGELTGVLTARVGVLTCNCIEVLEMPGREWFTPCVARRARVSPGDARQGRTHPVCRSLGPRC